MNATEKIMNYLNEFAKTDTHFAECLKNPSKNKESMMAYILTQARKEATNNAACIDDDTVYQWARHYYLEDNDKLEITEKIQSTAQVVVHQDTKTAEWVEPNKTPKRQKAEKQTDVGQTFLFDL